MKTSETIKIKKIEEQSLKLPTKWLHIGSEKLLEELFVAPKNQVFNKPIGGLWASPYTANEKYKSSWHRWLEYEMPHWMREYGVVFTLKKESKIFTIDSSEDLKYLMDNYKCSRSHLKHFSILDFEKIKKDYDGIFLTNKGQWETRLSLEYNLYGWDVECLLLLNFQCIEQQEKISFFSK